MVDEKKKQNNINNQAIIESAAQQLAEILVAIIDKAKNYEK